MSQRQPGFRGSGQASEAYRFMQGLVASGCRHLRTWLSSVVPLDPKP